MSVSLRRAFLRVWGEPLGAGIGALFVYTLIGVVLDDRHLSQSGSPYFIYLADAFLHGQLALIAVPPSIHDLVEYAGRLYLYWPPLPAIILMPLVALFGTQVSDVPLHLAVGGLNVALVSVLLRELQGQRIVDLSPDKRAWLTVFFAFGTVHSTLAPHASVWYFSQVVAFAFQCGVYLAVLLVPGRKGAAIAGLIAACALLSRNTTVLALVWPAWYLLKKERAVNRGEMAGVAVSGLVPVAAGVLLLLVYNFARFGSPVETGLDYQMMANTLKEDHARYGTFNLHYLPDNLFYYLIAIPYLSVFTSDSIEGLLMGGSLFLMSPLFFLAFPGIVRSWRTHGWALAASCVGGIAPALLYLAPGWWQFGSRYTLDITAPLLVATAFGVERLRLRSAVLLTVISIEIFLPGTVLMSGVMGRIF